MPGQNDQLNSTNNLQGPGSPPISLFGDVAKNCPQTLRNGAPSEVVVVLDVVMLGMLFQSFILLTLF